MKKSVAHGGASAWHWWCRLRSFSQLGNGPHHLRLAPAFWTRHGTEHEFGMSNLEGEEQCVSTDPVAVVHRSFDRKHRHRRHNCRDHVLWVGKLHWLFDFYVRQVCSCRNTTWWWWFHSRLCKRFSVAERETEHGRAHPSRRVRTPSITPNAKRTSGAYACWMNGPATTTRSPLLCILCWGSRTANSQPTMTSSHGRARLEFCCALDPELAATEVKRSVVIRLASCEDLQLVCMSCVLRHTQRSCNAYDVVVNIWTLITCEDDALCKRTHENEKLNIEKGSLGMTCKLEVTAVGLCRHDVRTCDDFVGFGAMAVMSGEGWSWGIYSRGAAVSHVWSRKLSMARGKCHASRLWERSMLTATCSTRRIPQWFFATRGWGYISSTCNEDNGRKIPQEAKCVHRRVEKCLHGPQWERLLDSAWRDISGFTWRLFWFGLVHAKGKSCCNMVWATTM